MYDWDNIKDKKYRNYLQGFGVTAHKYNAMSPLEMADLYEKFEQRKAASYDDEEPSRPPTNTTKVNKADNHRPHQAMNNIGVTSATFVTRINSKKRAVVAMAGLVWVVLLHSEKGYLGSNITVGRVMKGGGNTTFHEDQIFCLFDDKEGFLFKSCPDNNAYKTTCRQNASSEVSDGGLPPLDDPDNFIPRLLQFFHGRRVALVGDSLTRQWYETLSCRMGMEPKWYTTKRRGLVEQGKLRLPPESLQPFDGGDFVKKIPFSQQQKFGKEFYEQIGKEQGWRVQQLPNPTLTKPPVYNVVPDRSREAPSYALPDRVREAPIDFPPMKRSPKNYERFDMKVHGYSYASSSHHHQETKYSNFSSPSCRFLNTTLEYYHINRMEGLGSSTEEIFKFITNVSDVVIFNIGAHYRNHLTLLDKHLQQIMQLCGEYNTNATIASEDKRCFYRETLPSHFQFESKPCGEYDYGKTTGCGPMRSKVAGPLNANVSRYGDEYGVPIVKASVLYDAWRWHGTGEDCRHYCEDNEVWDLLHESLLRVANE